MYPKLSPGFYWPTGMFKKGFQKWKARQLEVYVENGIIPKISTNDFLKSNHYQLIYAIWKKEECEKYLKIMGDVENPSIDDKIKILKLLKNIEKADKTIQMLSE